ncbi:hypothetical protein [Micromonospora sp. KC723]|nr:hypothetical protein [Micromonospora sp. KC723]
MAAPRRRRAVDRDRGVRGGMSQRIVRVGSRVARRVADRVATA